MIEQLILIHPVPPLPIPRPTAAELAGFARRPCKVKVPQGLGDDEAHLVVRHGLAQTPRLAERKRRKRRSHGGSAVRFLIVVVAIMIQPPLGPERKGLREVLLVVHDAVRINADHGPARHGVPVHNKRSAVVGKRLAPEGARERRGDSKGLVEGRAQVRAAGQPRAHLDVVARGEARADLGRQGRIGARVPRQVEEDGRYGRGEGGAACGFFWRLSLGYPRAG